MSPPSPRPAASLSRGMWIALAAALALTAASYGVRAWREARQAADLQESVVAAAPPANHAAPVSASAPAAAASPTAEGKTAGAAPVGKPNSAPAGLRPQVPAASHDAMQSRRAPPPLPVGEAPPPPPPPVALPPPNFRVIGRYAEGDLNRIILAHDNTVLVAKRGDTLPDGFRLRAIRADAIVVVRLANQEKIEIPLGNP